MLYPCHQWPRVNGELLCITEQPTQIDCSTDSAAEEPGREHIQAGGRKDSLRAGSDKDVGRSLPLSSML